MLFENDEVVAPLVTTAAKLFENPS